VAGKTKRVETTSEAIILLKSLIIRFRNGSISQHNLRKVVRFTKKFHLLKREGEKDPLVREAEMAEIWGNSWERAADLFNALSAALRQPDLASVHHNLQLNNSNGYSRPQWIKSVFLLASSIWRNINHLLFQH
jgi:transposase InsO family protein